MILLDTQVWFWWVQDLPRLSSPAREEIERRQADGLAVSIFSCWEIAKLVELGRIQVADPIADWLRHALAPSGVRALPLTLDIITDATGLPAGFHRDPADQIIVATSRVHGCLLLTVDAAIRAYPHVKTLP